MADCSISELTRAPQVDAESLFVIESQGRALRASGAQIKQFVGIIPDIENSASDISFDNAGTGIESTNVQGALNEIFALVSNGKALIASAITDAGIETADNATFEEMAENIRQINNNYTN